MEGARKEQTPKSQGQTKEESMAQHTANVRTLKEKHMKQKLEFHKRMLLQLEELHDKHTIQLAMVHVTSTLKVMRHLMDVNPDDPGLREKIYALEAELHDLEEKPNVWLQQRKCICKE